MLDLGASVDLGAGVEAAMASLAEPARVPVGAGA
jgi:hypothetical protein